MFNDDMKNYDLENVIDVVNSGIKRIEKKNTAMMARLVVFSQAA